MLIYYIVYIILTSFEISLQCEPSSGYIKTSIIFLRVISYWMSGLLFLSVFQILLTNPSCCSHYHLQHEIRMNSLITFEMSKRKNPSHVRLKLVDWWKHCPLAVMETCVSAKGHFDDGWSSLLQTMINHSNCQGSSRATEVVMQHAVPLIHLIGVSQCFFF